MAGGPRSATARRAASVASCLRRLGETGDPGREVGHAEPPADDVLGPSQAGVDGAPAHPDLAEAGRPEQGLERRGVLDRRRVVLEPLVPLRGDEAEPLHGRVDGVLRGVGRSGRERGGHDRRPRPAATLSSAAAGSGRCSRQNPAVTRSKRPSRTGAGPRRPRPPVSRRPPAQHPRPRRRRRRRAAPRGRRRRAAATAVPAPTSSTSAPASGTGAGRARPRPAGRRPPPAPAQASAGVVASVPPRGHAAAGRPRGPAAPTRRARRRTRRRPSPNRTAPARRAGTGASCRAHHGSVRYAVPLQRLAVGVDRRLLRVGEAPAVDREVPREVTQRRRLGRAAPSRAGSFVRPGRCRGCRASSCRART